MEDLTDAVFEDMFSPGKGTSNTSSRPPPTIKGLTRNETATNPFLLRWRKAEASSENDGKLITEL